jgi:hypothetical protein
VGTVTSWRGRQTSSASHKRFRTWCGPCCLRLRGAEVASPHLWMLQNSPPQHLYISQHIYIYIYIYIYTHTHIHTYIHIHIHTFSAVFSQKCFLCLCVTRLIYHTASIASCMYGMQSLCSPRLCAVFTAFSQDVYGALQLHTCIQGGAIGMNA